MTLKECYRILGLAGTAKTDDVKRAYRRRAFELHPDLNPNLVDASRQFQLLNEAYVVLMRVLSEKEAKAETKTEARGSEKREQARQEGTARGPGGSEDSAGPSSGHSTQEDQAGRKDTGDAAGTSGARATAGQTSGQTSGQTFGQAFGTGRAAHEEKASAADEADSAEARKRRMADSAYAQQEDVLRDILSDQFARRVFEDIYSEVNKKTARAEEKAIPPAPPKPRKLNLEWGDRIVNLDFTGGLGGMVSNWLRHQIDDALTVQLPRAKLFPGARVRLQIRQGIKNELRVVEVILPPDFKTGKAIRLKGMGRKVGKWSGDLYLTIEAQQ